MTLLAAATMAGVAPNSAAASGGAALPGAPDLLATPSGVVWAWGAAAPSNSQVLRSSNGGRQWQRVLDVPTPANGFGLTATYFLGPEDAWAVKQNLHGDGVGETTTVYSTSDGGAHWYHSKALPGDLTTCCLILFDQVYFANPEDGWVLASGQNMAPGTPTTLSMLWWRSTDGGRSWTAMPASALPFQGRVTGGLSAYAPCPAVGSPHLTFSSAETGWFTEGDCAAGAARPMVWRTTDGGWHWARGFAPPAGERLGRMVQGRRRRGGRGCGQLLRGPVVCDACRPRRPRPVQPRYRALQRRWSHLARCVPAGARLDAAGRNPGRVVRGARPWRMVSGGPDRGLLDRRQRRSLGRGPLDARP